MKKIIAIVLCLLVFAMPALAAETVYCTFDGEDSIKTVTNTLSSGGSAVYTEDGFIGNALALNGSYGVELGAVSNVFSVSAMVKITSTGSTDTIFFKNMGTSSSQKWTGVQSRAGKAAFWTHGSGFSWTTVKEASEAELSSWAHVVYVENAGTGSLYVNGALVGSGSVVNESGTLYLGSTYWSSDAPKGYVDELKLYNTAITAKDVTELYDMYANMMLSVPAEVIGDIELPAKLGTKSLKWTSGDESVITSGGKVTRYDEDKTVTLTAYIGGEIFAEYEVKVLKKPVVVNDSVILSYTFGENDGDVIHDVSGNGNHAAVYGGLTMTKDGAYFDGVDDYAKMPEGVLGSHDNMTIIFTAKPESEQENVFAYGFGNGTSDGYMFLNTSRPTTNTLRFAITKTSYSSEKAVASVPGIRSGEWGCAIVTLEGNEAKLYLDGELVMSGDLGIKASELGKTTENYIAKSLYSADPYFKGTVSEFTVLGYAMDSKEIKARYAAAPEYEKTVKEEYITSLSFDGGITAEIDDFGRDDVYIAAAVMDENGELASFSVGRSAEELEIEGDNIIVFAFNEQDNLPGKIYTKGTDGKIDYEYTPGSVRIVNNDRDYTGGVAIIAGYDASGELLSVTLKNGDVLLGDEIKLEADFDGVVSFRLLYWNSVASLMPAE